ncbi:MAG TPA: radical SAM protein [Candidatus Acidoferrales bacterium]|jgi:anaerobic magnesium-protoporphyrin IX monomethyl ester cyclase|nr:radical SAM protein [Candidatus Acidoferrales bacterium]
MRLAISYPPLESDKGVALLSQNRQFQWFNNPTFIYPMIPAYAATLLQTMGHDVVWDDAIAERRTEEEWLRWYAGAGLDLIAFESKTPTIKKHWRLIERMKAVAPDTLVVLMGDHVTGFPEESLEHSPVDYVLTGGDFDFSLRDLVGHLDHGAPLGPGVYFRGDGKIATTGPYSLLNDLNELPTVDRELTKWQLYAFKNGNFKHLPGTYTMAGRDCWWGHCTFCSWTMLFPGQKFRTRTPQLMLDEIDMLADKYGIREIFDDTGTLPIGEWLHEFCEGLIERGLNKKIKFGCNMRFNYLTKDEYRLMGRAGFRFILYGLESANQSTLQRLAKNMTTETIAQELRWAKGAGLAPHLTTMIGYPWESKEETRNTIEFAKRMFRTGCVDTLQATVVIPYAGTPLYKEAEHNDWLLSKDWDDYDMRQPVLKSPLSPAETMALTQELYRSFLSPQFVWNKLVNIRSWDDVQFIGRSANYVLGHLTDFTAKR